MSWTLLTRCVACAAAEVVPFLALGPQPLANSFLTPEQDGHPEAFYPMNVAHCPSCGHVQLTELVDRAVLFSHYLYVSGTSDAVPAHFQELARQVTERLSPPPGALVVEAGSNDGTLLRAFQARGLRVHGVEPATNIASQAVARGVPTLNRFFDAKTAADVAASEGQAAIVVGTNVFAHVGDPADFLAGARTLLAPDGLLVIEVPYLVPMLEKLEFDTIYHEHVSYFALGPLTKLFARSGLALVGAALQAVHGGSIRLYGRRTGEPDAELRALLAREAALDLPSGKPQREFARRVRLLPERLAEQLDALAAAGKRTVAYGAAAKGTTLSNYCRLFPWAVPWVADKAPLKQGRLMPGTHIPVVHPDRIDQERPDVLLLLAWNFAAEIMRQQSRHAERGGRFLLPVPDPRLAP